MTLATLTVPDVAAVNRTFGTSLRAEDFQVFPAPPRYGTLRRAMRTQGALLDICLTMRLAQNVDREQHFDLLFSTENEADFGRRGISYVHFPWVYLPRPEVEMRWFHRIPGVLNGYRVFCQRIARSSNEGLRRNLMLANSKFVARHIQAVHGIGSTVLYPPVAGGFPDVPWERRKQGFVAIGRFTACKRWDMAVSIIEEVRRRGHDVTLTLIGSRDDAAWYDRLAAMAGEHPWFRMKSDISRAELAEEVASHRYGIHTMECEHFGLAPAEIQRAGGIVFVHRSGGPMEIVGEDPRLMFENVSDAADKIARVLESPDECADVQRQLTAQRGKFSEEVFCSSLRDIAERFMA